ncbi:MAG TPA: arsenate reductase ArsC [Terriglobales bacterium]
MKPKALFLCTGNSARSQMAEGLLRDYAGDRYDVFSAGTKPSKLNPLAVEAMREIGIDISHQHSKDVISFLGTPIQYVITVCDRAKESCPVFPSAFQFLSWSFEDPADAEGTNDEKLVVFRRVRDQIAERIKKQFLQLAVVGNED